MTNNTKQSEDTRIQWSVNMNNAIQVGQLATEPILTIHPDGRVTTSPRLKPDEISALVLDQIKTQWLKDAQATKIRELEAELERTKQERNAIAKNTREPLLLKLDEANERINALIYALVPLVEMWEWFNNDAENSEAGTQVGAYYGFYKSKYEKWDAAIAVLKREEVK